MLTYRQALTYLLLNYCVVYATHWINLYAFNGKLSTLGAGIVATLIVLGFYPLLRWRRDSPWVKIGSFTSWVLLSLAIGTLTFLLYTASGLVVRYYSPA